MSIPQLILASASPRRRQLLTEAGFRFQLDPADIDELDYAGHLSPVQIAELLASRKAAAVADRHPHDVTLAADTVVAAAPLPPGQPADLRAPRRAAAAADRPPHDVPLAADPVVAAADGEPVGKPVNADDARRILRRLSGTRHQVITAVHLLSPAHRLN